MLIGCVADDLTGATDLALMFVRGGMRTVQVIGVPDSAEAFGDADAVVIALKSRTIPAADAVAQSRAAAGVLRKAGARQIFFKYCSTFDSTDDGNIGPVADALADDLGAGIAIACPAFPENGRSIYQGNLFVGSQPLAESPMKDHPLTPMRDSDLVRVLSRQTARKVGLVPFQTVARGADAVGAALAALARDGCAYAVVDAITNPDLFTIGAAVAEAKLITGGSGIALGLPENFRKAGLLTGGGGPDAMQVPAGRPAILAGSCSTATRGQIRTAIEAGIPALKIDPLDLAAGTVTPAQVLAWIDAQASDRPFLVYSSDDPAAVGAAQAKLGREKAGEIVEHALAAVAVALPARGVTRMLVAGGETSGAVVTALGVKALAIGPEIDPGVPWTRTLDGPAMALALKSGNFGAPDFFLKAWDLLP